MARPERQVSALVTHATLVTDPVRTQAARVLYWLAFLLGLTWAVHLCLHSTGVVLDDEIGHYLLSRNVVRFPANLLNLWGRPVMTALYVIPAQGGLRGAQLFSVLISALMVLSATWLAGALGVRHLFLVPLLLWFQPWFTDLSYAVLPQAAFGLWLTAGTAAWATGRLNIASVLFGLLPLTRHEGIALVGLWVVYLVATRQWRSAIVAVIPFVLFNAVYVLVKGSGAYGVYVASQYSTFYGRGGWLHFVRPLIWDVGPMIVALAALGAWTLRRQPSRLALFTGFVVYFVMHTVIFHFGLFESGGYSQFMIPIAPAFAICAALGVEWLVVVTMENRHWPVRRAELAAWLVPAVAGVMLAVIVAHGMGRPPHALSGEHVALQNASDWLRQSSWSDREVAAANVYFCYAYPVPPRPDKYWASPPRLADVTPGSIVVWDRHYADRAGLQLSELTAPTGSWRRVAAFGSDDFAVIFERTGIAATAATPQ